jgi:hypothetical protein
MPLTRAEHETGIGKEIARAGRMKLESKTSKGAEMSESTHRVSRWQRLLFVCLTAFFHEAPAGRKD